MTHFQCLKKNILSENSNGGDRLSITKPYKMIHCCTMNKNLKNQGGGGFGDFFFEKLDLPWPKTNLNYFFVISFAAATAASVHILHFFHKMKMWPFIYQPPKAQQFWKYLSTLNKTWLLLVKFWYPSQKRWWRPRRLEVHTHIPIQQKKFQKRLKIHDSINIKKISCKKGAKILKIARFWAYCEFIFLDILMGFEAF